MNVGAKRWSAIVGLGAAVLAIGACGGSSSSSGGSGTSGGSKSGGKSVTVYSSLPLQGAAKTITSQIVNGMQLAITQAHGRAGDVTVKYVPLDDSTAQAGTWDPGQVAQNARKAVQDSSAVAYLGEYNSGGSAVSIPLTNQGGLAQLSSTNTYVGLTTNEPGSAPGEPQKYYPTGKRTYVRIVPRDTIQAAALLALMKQDGCTNVAIANDRDTFGIALAQLMVKDARAAGFPITSNTGIQKDAPNFRSYAAGLVSQKPTCFLFAGVTANGAVQLTKDVAAALPNARLYVPDGSCESGFTNPSQGGIPTAIGKRVKCTVATRDLPSYPGGKAFVTAYAAAFGNSHPDPYAIYGYEAMRLTLDTIRAGGTDRASFLTHLFETKNRDSVLGTYSLDANGDTSVTDYGVYKVGPSGDPVYVETIRAKG